MSNKESLDMEAAARLQPLVGLAIQHANTISDIQLHRGHRMLAQRLGAPPRRQWHWALLGSAAAFAVVAIGFLTIGVWRPASQGLAMTVEGATLHEPSGLITPLSRDRSADLHFSDGSHVQMAPHSRARVQKLESAGAKLAIETGKLRARIEPKRKASWDFEAGPFQVHVVGTAFDLGWEQVEGVLVLAMKRGRVTVSGPLIGEGMPVVAGQTLNVSLATGKVRLESPSVAPVAAGEIPVVPEASPASAEVEIAPAEAPRASVVATPSPGRKPERWSQMLREGAVSDIVADAQASGINRALARAPLPDLQALADAARYLRNNKLASRALRAQRQRFPASKAAREAAFHLGRLQEATNQHPEQALIWYDRYLAEDVKGTYRAEAVGRKMVVLEQLQQTEAAQLAATQYLRLEPQGAYAKIARGLLGTP